MKAFINSTMTKDQTIDHINQHIEADALIKGLFWDEDDFKGCHIGCLVHSDNYKDFETIFSVDHRIAQLCDAIHEGLPTKEKRIDFFKSALPSISVGAETSIAWHKFAYWLLVDPAHGVIRFVDSEDIENVINNVANLHMRCIHNIEVTESEWDAAWDAARDATNSASNSADWDAAWAAAWAADWDEAWEVARYAANSVARDATRAADWDAAWNAALESALEAHNQIMADKLIEILNQLPVDES